MTGFKFLSNKNGELGINEIDEILTTVFRFCQLISVDDHISELTTIHGRLKMMRNYICTYRESHNRIEQVGIKIQVQRRTEPSFFVHVVRDRDIPTQEYVSDYYLNPHMPSIEFGDDTF